MRIHLIACSSSKLDRPAPARELYTGDLYRASRAYAEHQGGPWAILSAKHGLVLPDTILDPYDLRLRQLDRDHRQAWIYQVEAAIDYRFAERNRIWRGVYGYQYHPLTLVLLAGAEYVLTSGVRESLASRLRGRGWQVETPLARMGIGKQRQWLRRQIAEPLLREVPA